MRIILGMLCFILFGSLIAQNGNKYGIKLIEDYEHYKKQITAQPELEMIDLYQ